MSTLLDTINLILGTDSGGKLVSLIDDYINSNFNETVTFTPAGGKPLNALTQNGVVVPKSGGNSVAEFKVDTNEKLEAWFSYKVFERLSEIKKSQQQVLNNEESCDSLHICKLDLKRGEGEI